MVGAGAGRYPLVAAAYNAAVDPGWWGGAPAFVAPDRAIREAAADLAPEAAAQCDLVRDIFGSPFAPFAVEPTWLTSTVVALAEAIYAGRAFHDLAVLADALQEAGCDDGEVLGHCRGAGTHTRGCWVLDLLTGRG